MLSAVFLDGFVGDHGSPDGYCDPRDDIEQPIQDDIVSGSRTLRGNPEKTRVKVGSDEELSHFNACAGAQMGAEKS